MFSIVIDELMKIFLSFITRKFLSNTLISFVVDILFFVKISFAINFFSIIIKKIVVVVFVIDVFFKSNYRYIKKLSMSTRNIVNAIIIINFSSTKNQTQTQTRKIRIFSTIEFVEYSLEWTIDRIVFKIVVRQFHVVIVEYKITSIYLKFLSINFRVENSLVDDTFVEKQSQIRLLFDEFKTLNYSFVTNLSSTKNQFD